MRSAPIVVLLGIAAICAPSTPPVYAQDPNFGPNVKVFDPTMSISSIQSTCNSIFTAQQKSQFGTGRYALLFKPGAYSGLTVNIGYYTQALGLDPTSPNNTLITGAVQTDASWNRGNATLNFWRGMENLEINPTAGDSAGTTVWAASQACPVRRVHVQGAMKLSYPTSRSWSSGGFIADSVVDGQIDSGTQQQYCTRNVQMGSWTGSNWNLVFVGDTGAPATSFPSYTNVSTTPVVREKPFLTYSAATGWNVFVPALKTSYTGSDWANNASAGTLIPISTFYIAQSSTDNASTINTALASGKNILFTPGIYSLNGTIQVNNPNTVLLGIGLATLNATGGADAIHVADVDGVTVAGLILDANSAVNTLLQVGPSGSSLSHAANPTLLADVFVRVGGADAGSCVNGIVINSNNVIGDGFWIWRADHGTGVGWTSNTAINGMVVNGQNVTLYDLQNEHFQQYQTVWNGNNGSLYMYQSECPYDVPNQASWMDGTIDGYASYKVGSAVTSHTAYGLGIYSNFTTNSAVIEGNAIEAPTTGMNFNDMLIWSWSGEIKSIINGQGGPATKDQKATLLNYQ